MPGLISLILCHFHFQKADEKADLPEYNETELRRMNRAQRKHESECKAKELLAFWKEAQEVPEAKTPPSPPPETEPANCPNPTGPPVAGIPASCPPPGAPASGPPPENDGRGEAANNGKPKEKKKNTSQEPH